MTEPILEQKYWTDRYRTATERHHAIFRCPLEKWVAIERAHRIILAQYIKDTDSILDCGCGWGRLLTLMPRWWIGPDKMNYLGIDLSETFIEMAREQYPSLEFRQADLRKIPLAPAVPEYRFDWAVMISIRPMVKRNLGDESWAQMESEIRRCAKKLLYLEYDPDDKGSVE